MDRRGWVIAGVAAVGLTFVALVASAEPIQMFHDPTTPRFTPRFDADNPSDRQPGEPTRPPTEGLNLPLVSVQVERILVVIMIIVLALLILRSARRWLRDLSTEDEPDFGVLPDVQAALVDAAAAQREELLHGSPRNAIVACWVRLEECVEGAGLARDRAETSSELTARVLASYVVDRRAIDDLAALYREARFSQHELTEEHRGRAINALDDLHAQLRRPITVTPPAP